MKHGLIVIGAAVLALVAAALAVVTLPSCGLVLPFGLPTVQFCPAPAAIVVDVSGERDALLQQITEAEGRLAALQCQPAAELPASHPPAALDAPLDRSAIESGEPSAVQGCWTLVSQYQTFDPDTGKTIDFTDWQVCLAADGTGHEVMHGSDGTICQGDVDVTFQDGALIISEPADLPCSNHYSIYQRKVICTADDSGTAQCRSIQPAKDGYADVIMRRTQEQP